MILYVKIVQYEYLLYGEHGENRRIRKKISGEKYYISPSWDGWQFLDIKNERDN